MSSKFSSLLSPRWSLTSLNFTSSSILNLVDYITSKNIKGKRTTFEHKGLEVNRMEGGGGGGKVGVEGEGKGGYVVSRK